MRFIRSGDNHSIIAVTAERYVAVVRPLQAASVCRRRRAAAVMASLVLAFVQSYSPAGANAHPPVVACRVLAFVQLYSPAGTNAHPAVMASFVLAFVQSYSPAGANAHPAVMASLVLTFVQSYSPAGANAHPRSWHAVFLPSSPSISISSGPLVSAQCKYDTI